MKKTGLVALLLILGFFKANSQATGSPEPVTGYSNLGTLSILAPTGEFSETHTVGVGLTYNWSRGHFGYFDKEKMKRIGLLVSTGMEYYFGKENLTTAGYPFSFGNYFNFHLMPGAIYNFHKKAEVNLVAGPTIALHNESASFAVGSNLNASYYVQPNMAIGVGVLYKKHEYVKSLWAIALKGSYSF